MACEKTGAYARLPDGRWAYGDMHCFDGTWVFRICDVSHYHADPAQMHYHFSIHTWETWFEEFAKPGTISTMVCLSHQLHYHGYDGIPTKEDSRY